MRRFVAAAVSALALARAGYSQELKAKVPTVDSAELTRLADQLGDRDYRVREQAGKRLGELGADALPTLRKVVESGNLEATDRAVDLVAKIERHIANAKSTAGTLVELPADEQTLGAAFDALRKQTGYTIQLNGDQSPRSKKVTPKAGKVIFWEVLQSLAGQADLEVESAVSTAGNGPVNIPANPNQPKDTPPIGTVVLRPKPAKSNPVCISGAFRIEAIPVPAVNLPQMPANRVPVLLQITPEPRLRWICTTQTLVTMAKDQDGRSLVWDYVAPDLQPNNYAYEGRRIGRGKGGYYGGQVAPAEFPATPFQAYVKLLAPDAGTSNALKEIEGKIRGKIWSQPETMLAIAGLSDTVQEIYSASLSLKAKYEPMPGDAAAHLMSITTTYNAGEVIPYHGNSALNTNPDGLWLENGPGGRVKLNAVKLNAEELRLAQGFTNAYGLALVDGRGKPMNLSPHTVTQRNQYDQFTGTQTIMIVAQYVVRPADKDDAAKPAKLTFNGTRMKTLEVPFKLKDVAVLRGLGTNIQPITNNDNFDR